MTLARERPGGGVAPDDQGLPGRGVEHRVVLHVGPGAHDDVEQIEDYVQREHVAEGVDPTAPRVAGA